MKWLTVAMCLTWTVVMVGSWVTDAPDLWRATFLIGSAIWTSTVVIVNEVAYGGRAR